MKKLSEGIKYWGQLLWLPVYWLSFLFPRDRHIWLFGSTFGRRFADNPRYFYLYVSQHSDRSSEKVKESVRQWKAQGHAWEEDANCKDIRAVWISHDKGIVDFLQENGYEAYAYHSLKGIWYALRGKVYLFDNYSKDINFWQSGGALKFNMWHGVPLKKIQADNVFDKVRHPKNIWEAWKAFPRRLSDEKPNHYVLATSAFMAPVFESAFRTKHVSTAGYPRVDGFAFDGIRNVCTGEERRTMDKIEGLLNRDRNCKMIYYMPTFRNSETEFFQVVDLGRFEQFLREHHLVFCTKLHPKSKLSKQFREMEGGNLVNIDADADPYVFVSMSDALVTDYSSIYFDYLFADKPIVFFDYDLKTYLEDSREMYFDYEAYTPGIKAADQEELERALLEIAEGIDGYGESRKQLQHTMFHETETAVSGSLVREIQDVVRH